MRDVGKVKDRFEFKLDSNRVFFLFAGLAAYSALIFVLGIVVGRSGAKGAGGEVASAPVMLPDERPTPQKIEDRLADAQPKATEEPEIPLKAIWELDKPPADQSLNASITPTKPGATPTPVKPAATPAATPAAVAEKTPAPTPDKTPEKVASVPAAGAKFTLQVIAYNDLKQAEEQVSALKKRGFDAYTVTAQIPGKGTVHRVRVGHYPSRATAETAATQLAAAQPGTKPLVVAFE